MLQTGCEAPGAVRCADCGAEVIGRFCHACGQSAEIHRSLLHLGEELLHGVMHFDGRLWRTLPLLAFRPGRLTREWVQGRRTRYVSPLTIFLFTIFLTFMLLSFLPLAPKQMLAERQAEANAHVAQAAADLAKAEQVQRAAPAGVRATADEELTKAREDLRDARAEAEGLRTAAGVVAGAPDWFRKISIDTGDKRLDEKLRHKLENPELALYKLEQTFYKFSFLLVPISLPFVAALFLWKRGFTFYDHSVFVLYSLTFVSALLLIVSLLGRMPGGWTEAAVGALPLVVPLHMFFQLKGAYGLSVLSALWRLVLLLVFCLVALVLFVVSVIYLGVA